MRMCDPSAKIDVIQGDSIDRYFALVDDADETLDPAQIAAVFFSSGDLKQQQRLTYDETQQAYILHLPPETTAALEPGVYTYDITVAFADAKRRTATYNGRLTVLQKINIVDYGEGG